MAACRRSRPSVACSKRSEEHTSELQSPDHLVCRLLLEKKKQTTRPSTVRVHWSLGLHLCMLVAWLALCPGSASIAGAAPCRLRRTTSEPTADRRRVLK